MRQINSGIQESIVSSRSNKNKFSLTVRDIDILQMTADGYYTTDISEKWNISINTVKKNKEKICDLLGAENMVNAVAKALRKNLIT